MSEVTFGPPLRQAIDAQEAFAVSGRKVRASVAGMPCTIEADEHGEWVVVIAATTISRSHDLAEAIREAGGGVVSRREAEALAAATEDRLAGTDSRVRLDDQAPPVA